MRDRKGLVNAIIGLSSPPKPELRSLEVKSRVDTGAAMLCLPERPVIQLVPQKNGVRDITTADGRSHQVPYVGRYKSHSTTVFALSELL